VFGSTPTRSNSFNNCANRFPSVIPDSHRIASSVPVGGGEPSWTSTGSLRSLSHTLFRHPALPCELTGELRLLRVSAPLRGAKRADPPSRTGPFVPTYSRWRVTAITDAPA